MLNTIYQINPGHKLWSIFKSPEIPQNNNTKGYFSETPKQTLFFLLDDKYIVCNQATMAAVFPNWCMCV